MKTFSILSIALFVLSSCQKEVISKLSSASVSNDLAGQITFSSNLYPKHYYFTDSTDRYLLGDSFNVSVNCTLDTVVVYYISAGATASHFRLLIDGNVVDTVISPVQVFYGEYQCVFTPSVSLNAGDHKMKIKGLVSGVEGVNMYIQILTDGIKARDSAGNLLTTSGLPISKKKYFLYLN